MLSDAAGSIPTGKVRRTVSVLAFDGLIAFSCGLGLFAGALAANAYWFARHSAAKLRVKLRKVQLAMVLTPPNSYPI